MKKINLWNDMEGINWGVKPISLLFSHTTTKQFGDLFKFLWIYIFLMEYKINKKYISLKFPFHFTSIFSALLLVWVCMNLFHLHGWMCVDQNLNFFCKLSNLKQFIEHSITEKFMKKSKNKIVFIKKKLKFLCNLFFSHLQFHIFVAIHTDTCT